ncbi:BMP family protein [uncultured Desulfovibrio sp.]|uniref:BMP family lipoprotein n=4 Tax=uncultured Desulfovibrio sp. TaxID=167968 RepID=UPI0026388BB4|nr:BMP family ABC transporter substrate-binding protein [uncultured Desulfovibrio sp.]
MFPLYRRRPAAGLSWLLFVALVFAPLAAPAASDAAPPAPARHAQDAAASPLRVTLLLEHNAATAWTDLLRAGLARAERELPIQAAVRVLPPDSDQQAAFRQAARESDLVLAASDRLHEVLRNNAANFRKTMFGCIDAGVRAPNIMSVTFADEQAAYLAGAAAAMLTRRTALPGINEANVIGWISGEDTPALRSQFNGFSEGARLIDPQIRVLNAVAGSFTDARAARREARRLLEQGADVLALAAGAGNEGALAEARERNIYIIGLDADQAATLPGHVLTSILKRADKAVYEIVASAAEGNFQGKTILTYDLSNDGVDIASLAPFLSAAGKNAPPDLERRLRELRAELLNGAIRLKSLRARTLCDCL